MEPPCRICTRVIQSAAFNPRTLESRYKSPVTRRREYYQPTTYNAKVGTDLVYEFNSGSYNVERGVNKIQELKRNVQDPDRPKCHDETNKFQEESLSESSMARINDLKEAHRAVITCLREMEKIKMFLEDENSWWKILKARSTDCCQQKMPHLHGVLDGASVTLMLLEEGTDETPRHFVTSMSKEESNVADSRFGTSSKELTSEAKRVKQYTDRQPEHADEYENSYTIPYYSLDVQSALIEVTNTNSYEPTQRYIKRAVMSDQSIAPSEFWTEVQEDESAEHQRTKTPERLHSDEYQRAKTPERSRRSKEIRDIQYEAKEKIETSNIMPSREIRYDRNFQTTFEDPLKFQEASSRENNESKKYTSDFESNVDLNTKIPARNMSSHKPRAKTIVEKSVRCIQTKLPTKISRNKSRD
ncbi:uncharacterized protein LOC105838478 isoform X1 [Monomorium pharaonis]|uniref:uncharacterized protein LOC105838478 isoform X1 n=1 Tax=Monomorium pharaonis TaxID=307658 RepID=UPI00174601D1|nr:uncharacterized protein LOC105838478 isoform X1 [Monomorium pharaonis]XP_036140485.1 uncharacterized protein LOC105838478 isoform X1 [Monomorium pharaonis]